MNYPQISVVIPIYNRGALIQKTVESVLEQDISPDLVEIFLIDDGSSDDTWPVLQQLYGQHERVRLFRLENGGVARARNFGLQHARGEFIAFLDHDDLWLPQKLRLQREMLLKNPRLGVVACLWHDRTQSGEIIAGHQMLLSKKDWNFPHGRVLDRLLRNNYIVSMTIPMIHTALMREVGGMDDLMVPCDDWDLWIRLAQRCEFGVVREVCVIYQRHDAQQSSDSIRMLEASQRVTQKHKWMAIKHPRVMWIACSMNYFMLTQTTYYDGARAALAARDWRSLKRSIRACRKRFPWMWLTPQWLYLVLRLLSRDSSPF